MKKHTSRLFGDFSYEEDQVIKFPKGLLGFPHFNRFVLKGYAGTDPILWLLSVEDGGPELALIDPAVISPAYSYDDLPLDQAMVQTLHTSPDGSDITAYAIVTLPENIQQMSMNLRTPILIDWKSRRGMEYPGDLNKLPVRCLIYRDLIASRPEDKNGTLVIKRKVNETFNIGDEISVQVVEFANGGVRLCITAPKHVRVSRGESLVTPECETVRATENMDIKRLEGIMGMYHVMQGDQEALEQTVQTSMEEPAKAV